MSLDQSDEFCRACNGVASTMGRLGPLVWYRCRWCGMDFSVDATLPHEED